MGLRRGQGCVMICKPPADPVTHVPSSHVHGTRPTTCPRSCRSHSTAAAVQTLRQNQAWQALHQEDAVLDTILAVDYTWAAQVSWGPGGGG